jgi:hypothetical protein
MQRNTILMGEEIIPAMHGGKLKRGRTIAKLRQSI